MKYLMWLLKAAIFFTLFAFALNNQQVVAVNFFFGTIWKAPLVMVVLLTFACGLALGVLLMMPRWWKKKRSVFIDNSGNRQWTSKFEPGSTPALPAGSPANPVGASNGAVGTPHGL